LLRNSESDDLCATFVHEYGDDIKNFAGDAGKEVGNAAKTVVGGRRLEAQSTPKERISFPGAETKKILKCAADAFIDAIPCSTLLERGAAAAVAVAATEQIVTCVSEVLTGTDDLCAAFINAFGEDIVNGLNKVGDFAVDAANAVGDAVGNAANEVGNAVGGTANKVGNEVGNAANEVGNAVGGTANNVGNEVGNAANEVGNVVGGTTKKVGKSFKKIFG